MIVSEVLAKVKKRPTRKRCGRGRGSGLGKTSGRGHKGAGARSGFKNKYSYGGGQVPIFRRMPKRGFTNSRFRIRYDIVNLDLLNSHFQAGETVSLEVLVGRGLLREEHGRLKVLGDGELTKKLNLVAHRVSGSARQKIESLGGTIQSVGPPPKKKKNKPVIRLKPAPKKKTEEPEGEPAGSIATTEVKGAKGAAKAAEGDAERGKGGEAGKPEKGPKKGQKEGQKKGTEKGPQAEKK